jgi:hypothetical protein
LLFLNDDVELVGEGSLQRLVSYLMLDPMNWCRGCPVCCTMSEQGGGVQHDGVVTEQGWIARNIDCEIDGTGLGMPRNVSAVTGASLC